MIDGLDVAHLLLVFPDVSEPWLLDGLLCGGICAGLGEQGVTDLIRSEGTWEPLDAVAFSAFFEHRRSAIADADMGFAPLIPAPDQPLPERMQGLASWCLGFCRSLDGVDMGRLQPDMLEVMQTLDAVSRGARVSGRGEEEERAFFEIVELVRVGVALLFLGLHESTHPGEEINEKW